MEPVEIALAATAASLVNAITFNTARLGIETEGLEIGLKTTINPRALYAFTGPEENGSGLGEIEYDVKVTGDLSNEELNTIKELCAQSAANGLMSEGVNISGNVSRG